MFQDQVFCFTPKGEVVKLPRGATPIDFAYAIHTRIGDSCVGAKVDGQRVPLWTKLRNGQSVTIIRAEGQRPQPSWEDMVVTGRAKAAIRRSLRGEQRATQVRLGREIARVALERVGKKATDKALETAAKRLGLDEAEDVLARLGAAEMTGKDLVATLYPELLRDAALPRSGDKTAPVVIGLGTGQVARPGALLQPDPRRAHRRHRGARQGRDDPRHRLRRARSPSRTARTAGSTCAGPRASARPDHTARIEVTMANDSGVLGRICTLIGEQRANITDILFTDRKPDFFRMVIDIEVRDMEHLTHVLTAIDADSDVAQVRRYRGGRRQGRSRRGSGRRGPRGGEAAGADGLQATRQAARSSRASARRWSRARGWRRGIEYLGHRVRRLPDTPHRIALGFATRGPRLFTPFFGRTSCSPPPLARLVRGNMVAGADRHARRQPADLPADRLRSRSDSAGASSATAPAARTSSGSRTPSARPRAGSGRACSPSSAAARASGAGSSRSSITCSGPTSSAGCCPGSPRRSPATCCSARWSRPTRPGAATGCAPGRTTGSSPRSPRLTPARAAAYNHRANHGA